MKSLEIRQKFFSYFEKNGHTKVPSSSLIPAHDPTLLFANAGMNQFKDVFLGNEKRSYARAVSIQKCMRAGGKHNDLDNVGFTSRHLTFFEMMGNFSFGEYFKKEAIAYAWEFLTVHMQLNKELLHTSVFHEDEESYALWKDMIGVPANRIHRLGAKDNFWQMGDTGPCGPCTEIYVDRGLQLGCGQSTCSPACGCDRFLEIWNLVFMQYDRQPDGTDVPLKQTGVDTGMGLERLCAVMQNADTVYLTDLFMPIINRIEELTSKKYTSQDAQHKAAFHVLCDHIRSTSLLIADGCAPSNEGRGYVLRKIIRRAALFSQKLTDKSIFPELSRTVVEGFGEIYPELTTNKELIYAVLESEIKKFADNLIRGQGILERFFQENSANRTISGQQAFKLYDTFGFPTELIQILAHERGWTVDMQGFDVEMNKQQLQSGKKVEDALTHVSFETPLTSKFTGYQELQTDAHIIGLVKDAKSVKQVAAGHECWVIADKSPFFIVGGGQVPDQGWIMVHGYRVPIDQVRFIDTAIAARIIAPATIVVGDAITSIVDAQWRSDAMKNHTATHMLQAALIQLFGKQIKQSGSLVHPDYLRFDFTYHQNLSQDDIKRVEDLVNEKIRANIPVDVRYTDMKTALGHGALAFFGDKYNPEEVRMVMIPEFSTELCGGTHVHATGDIGMFKITEMSSLSAGHRRIVAVTGQKALGLFQECFNTVKLLSTEFKVQREELVHAINKQNEQLMQAHNQLKALKKKLWQSQIPSWRQQQHRLDGISYLLLALEPSDIETMRDIASHLSKESGFYCLVSNQQDKQMFVIMLSDDLSKKISLKDLRVWLKDMHNLSGGGSATVIQGGGVIGNIQAFDAALREWVAQNTR